MTRLLAGTIIAITRTHLAVDKFVDAKAPNFNKIQQSSTRRLQASQQESLRVNKSPSTRLGSGSGPGGRRFKSSRRDHHPLPWKEGQTPPRKPPKGASAAWFPATQVVPLTFCASERNRSANSRV